MANGTWWTPEVLTHAEAFPGIAGTRPIQGLVVGHVSNARRWRPLS